MIPQRDKRLPRGRLRLCRLRFTTVGLFPETHMGGCLVLFAYYICTEIVLGIVDSPIVFEPDPPPTEASFVQHAGSRGAVTSMLG